MSGSIASKRAKWRGSMKAAGTYSPSEYARRIPVHVDTLKKYLGEFHKYLAVWISRNQDNNRTAESCFGRDRLEEVLAGAEVQVREVFSLAEAKDLWPDFKQYFLGKTNLSYELGGKPVPRPQPRNTQSGPYHSKMAEFVFITLAEYLVLHNYCFVSKRKDGRMNSVDKWMKNL